jgi:hypothetical protein
VPQVNDGTWIETDKLTVNDQYTFSFGVSVALDTDVAVMLTVMGTWMSASVLQTSLDPTALASPTALWAPMTC